MLIEIRPLIEDPSSPIKRHVKWKLACTKRYRQMTSQATQEIFDKIVSSCLRFNFNNFFCIITTTSLEVCLCRSCYKTHYKNR